MDGDGDDLRLGGLWSGLRARVVVGIVGWDVPWIASSEELSLHWLAIFEVSNADKENCLLAFVV